MITAITFLLITFVGYVFALLRSPFWGIIVYANIYFNAPDPSINWWASYLPELRWSLLTAGVLIVSMFIHREKLSTHKYRSINWMFVFFLITLTVSYFLAINPSEAESLTSKFLTYLITKNRIVYKLAATNANQR